MEEYKTKQNGNKRYRYESGLDSDFHLPESKQVYTGPNSLESGLEVNRNSSEFDEHVDLDSPEAKRLREDILGMLDEPETVAEIHDLDSVIKSFEQEIINPPNLQPHQTFIDLTSFDSGDSQSDLGFLLEASDGDLGLPPTVSSANHIDAESRLNTIGFENELLRYDSFDYARIMEGDNYVGNSDADFVTVDGLFDYPDPSDFSELSWRSASLPAL